MKKYIVAMIAGLFVFATAFAEEHGTAPAEPTAAPAAAAPAAEAPAAEVHPHAKIGKHATKMMKKAKKAHKKAMRTETPKAEGEAPHTDAAH